MSFILGAFGLTVQGRTINRAGSSNLEAVLMAIDELNKKYKSENITVKFAFKDAKFSSTEGALIAVDLYRNAFRKGRLFLVSLIYYSIALFSFLHFFLIFLSIMTVI